MRGMAAHPDATITSRKSRLRIRSFWVLRGSCVDDGISSRRLQPHFDFKSGFQIWFIKSIAANCTVNRLDEQLYRWTTQACDLPSRPCREKTCQTPEPRAESAPDAAFVARIVPMDNQLTISLSGTRAPSTHSEGSV